MKLEWQEKWQEISLSPFKITKLKSHVPRQREEKNQTKWRVYVEKKKKEKKKNLLQDGQQKLQKSRYPFRRNSQQ